MVLNLFEILGVCIITMLVYFAGMYAGFKGLLKCKDKTTQNKFIDAWNKNI